ncbi:MAG: DUF4331 family protein [Kofleriaceae bacterium]
MEQIHPTPDENITPGGMLDPSSARENPSLIARLGRLSDSNGASHKGDPLKKLALFGTALALGAGVLVVTQKSQAADHLDAPTIRMVANAMADINDVYTWNTADGTAVNLAMTVSPGDDTTRHFGPSVQYVFHVTSHPGVDNPHAYNTPGTESKVICTFTSDKAGQCWVVLGSTVKDYVKGDFSSPAGLTSADGKIRVFAGRRADPFFFNLSGFHAAQHAIETGPIPPPDAAGCPALPEPNAQALRGLLSGVQAVDPDGLCTAAQADCFLHFDVEAIVLQVDKTLLLQNTDKLLSVWGSSHATPQ